MLRDVVVAIPTHSRPLGLRRLLDGLTRQTDTSRITILVGDNGAPDFVGLGVVAALQGEGYPLPVRAIAVPERGIPFVRNALVRAALDDPGTAMIAMIDDDEIPSDGWIAHLLAQQAETGAEVVGGAKAHRLPPGTPDWLADVREFRTRRRARSGPTDLVVSTCNVLVTRAAFDRVPWPPFDPLFAVTGGSDTDLFRRLMRAGASFAWSNEALTTEVIPPARATPDWVIARAWRKGNTDVLHRLKVDDGLPRRAMTVAAAAFACLVWTVRARRAPEGAPRLDALARVAEERGRIAAVFGVRSSEYACIHGD